MTRSTGAAGGGGARLAHPSRRERKENSRYLLHPDLEIGI